MPKPPESIVIDAVVFDAFGTLFDVHSVTTLAETLAPGHAAALAQIWRTKQLENGWDAVGAKAFGFKTFCISCARAPLDRHGPAPDRLADLPALLAT